jgi:uncharacterized protein (UPF0147 family)
MYFDERRTLNQPQSQKVQKPEGVTSARQANERPDRAIENRGSGPEMPSAHASDWQAANMLDSANNKLQELMQLLYLLSRDPGVPKDARYHVTVAQSEIALLAHVMRNNAQAQSSEPVAPVEDQARHAAHP